MNHESESRPLSWFRDEFSRGALELRPPFQRKPVWRPRQRCALIESILLDIPVPEVYIQITHVDEETERYGVVDGQQRIRTIMQFIGKETDPEEQAQNLFRLDKLPEASRYRDKTFGDLEKGERNALLRYRLCVRFLTTEDDNEVRDVFKRLNRYSMPLKPQELRNATYLGPFIKLSERLADDSYWAEKKIVSPAVIRRMTDIEMMSDLLIGLMHGPQDGGSKTLDKYYDQYEHFDDDFPDQRRVSELFDTTKDCIAQLLGNLTQHRWSNRADYYSLFVAIGERMGETKGIRSKPELRQAIVRFGEQVSKHVKDERARVPQNAEKYSRAIVKGPGSKARRVDRHEALLTVIGPFFKNR